MKTSPSKRFAGSNWSASFVFLLVCLTVVGAPAVADGQVVSQRGFVEGSQFGFPQTAPNDTYRGVTDLLVRDEVFVKPAEWIQFAAGMDLRANSHSQIDSRWAVDFWDRGVRRPRLSVRRLTATIARGPLTVDLGKQFVRWGAADIVNPTDRFAPRDYMNVVDSDFLGITAARAVVQGQGNTLDLVWTPRFTPSRAPLITQRWTATPPDSNGLPIVSPPPSLPTRSQAGVRWGHVMSGFEFSLSAFDGFNYSPDIQPTVLRSSQPPGLPVTIEVTTVYPQIRTYGGDAAVPLKWFTIKGEAAYFTSPSQTSDEYALYVLQLERQHGEWAFVGGYAGEFVSKKRTALTFAPDRGTSRSLLGRVSRTIDVNRSFSVEGAVRQNGHGGYVKGEYSQALGQHWRGTVSAAGLGGRSDDFFGQYRRNSHVILTLRCSF